MCSKRTVLLRIASQSWHTDETFFFFFFVFGMCSDMAFFFSCVRVMLRSFILTYQATVLKAKFTPPGI